MERLERRLGAASEGDSAESAPRRPEPAAPARPRPPAAAEPARAEGAGPPPAGPPASRAAGSRAAGSRAAAGSPARRQPCRPLRPYPADPPAGPRAPAAPATPAGAPLREGPGRRAGGRPVRPICRAVHAGRHRQWSRARTSRGRPGTPGRIIGANRRRAPRPDPAGQRSRRPAPATLKALQNRWAPAPPWWPPTSPPSRPPPGRSTRPPSPGLGRGAHRGAAAQRQGLGGRPGSDSARGRGKHAGPAVPAPGTRHDAVQQPEGARRRGHRTARRPVERPVRGSRGRTARTGPAAAGGAGAASAAAVARAGGGGLAGGGRARRAARQVLLATPARAACGPRPRWPRRPR
jgi:translation initiation factor IF-2